MKHHSFLGMRSLFPLLLVTVLLFSCKQKADLLVYNAQIYTVDASFTVVEAMVIKDGKIAATGTTQDLQAEYEAAEKLDAGGRPIYPGFIDAHAHFYRFGMGLQTADLDGTASWEEVLIKLQVFAQENQEGWLIGRGWDQNDWPGQQYPTKARLDALFPDRPVLLTRIDGHAALANQRALDAAGLGPGYTLAGGEVEMADGQLTGILVDNAVDLVSGLVPEPSPAYIREALDDAQNACFAVGLTSVTDCGLNYPQVLQIDSLQKSGHLKMRVYAMLSDAKPNYDFLFGRGKIKTDHLHVRAFKVYADGALGSRGACLLQPYADRPGWTGFLLSPPQHFDSVAQVLSSRGFQMCTHAIGDSANRAVLNIYAKYLQPGNDQRWRIEHAQVVNPADFSLFGQYNIIPSVQPTHATSDMYWAGNRLGPEREKGAYAYQQLLQQNGWILLGTDFPVEDISPFKTFLAAAVRTDASGFPTGGYQQANALSREETLRGMTIWAAKGNFEEEEKGSLEKGKLADFVMLDRDLMAIAPADMLNTTVLATYLGGRRVYGK